MPDWVGAQAIQKTEFFASSIFLFAVLKNGLCLRPLLQRQNGFVSFESHERTLYNRVSRKGPRERTSRDGEHPSEATKGTSRDGEHPSEATKGTSRNGEHQSEATKGTFHNGKYQSEATEGPPHNGKYQSEATEGLPHNGKYQSEATEGLPHNEKYSSEATEGLPHNEKYSSEATEKNLHKKYSNHSPWQRLRNEKIVVQLNKDPDERRIRNQKNRYIQIG